MKKKRKKTNSKLPKKKENNFPLAGVEPQTINMFGQYLNNSKIHLRKISKFLMVKAVPFLRGRRWGTPGR